MPMIRRSPSPIQLHLQPDQSTFILSFVYIYIYICLYCFCGDVINNEILLVILLTKLFVYNLHRLALMLNKASAKAIAIRVVNCTI